MGVNDKTSDAHTLDGETGTHGGTKKIKIKKWTTHNTNNKYSKITTTALPRYPNTPTRCIVLILLFPSAADPLRA